MTVIEFITKKNKILKDITGLTLIPDEHLVECAQILLHYGSDAGACPYCQAFTYEDNINWGLNCGDCPVNVLGIACGDEKSTYKTIQRKLDGPICDVPEIQTLVKQYNYEMREL